MSAPLQPITIRGRYLWQGDKRFVVRGVVYQDNTLGRQPYDPIVDEELPGLRHDVTLFKELGINTILVYNINPSKPHAQAMKLLEEAGIYVLACVYLNAKGISRHDPYGSYNAENVQSYFRTIDVMASFPNTLGMFVAQRLINSMMNDASCVACTLVIAAVVKDLKRYMNLRHKVAGQRILPVAYGGDNDGFRDKQVFEYLRTREESERIDFWTFTKYTWETSQSEMSSNLTTNFTHTNIPIFLSEYSDEPSPPNNSPQTNPTRPSNATTTLLSPSSPTHQILSGGCLYEFTRGPGNDYGLVRHLPHDETQYPGLPGGALRQALETERQNAAEQRTTDQGVILITQDFMTYKEKLEETRGGGEINQVEEGVEGVEGEGPTETISHPNPSSTPPMTMREQSEETNNVFSISGQVPSSCIHWESERLRIESNEE
ncbi:1,3-beta-glucanosyltransferase [Cercospora zeina]